MVVFAVELCRREQMGYYRKSGKGESERVGVGMMAFSLGVREYRNLVLIIVAVYK